MRLTIEEVLRLDHVTACNIEPLRGITFAGVSIDSRTIKQNELFFGIRGEKFDGNEFVKNGFEKGAACAVVEPQAPFDLFSDRPFVVVHDATKALGRLANWYRRKFDIPFIAIAGSNGKTTTKEMIATVLQTKYQVLSTQGNLNNHVGVPQTLFRLDEKHDLAVIEIGTNHFGELKYLCEILEPTHGLITNIGREHLEFFKDLDGVAQAEGELFDALGSAGTGFVNRNDAYVVKLEKKMKKKIAYGFSKPNVKVRGKFIGINEKACAAFSTTAKGRKPVNIQLTVPGKHSMYNALAAATVGLTFGVPAKNIQRALGTFTALGKRMEVIHVSGITILNDTYNANPDSMLSALETLQAMKCSGKKIVILADMLELGEHSQQEHEHVGNVLNTYGIDCLLTFGTMSRHITERAKVGLKFHYDRKNILSEYAVELVSPGDLVLVKGSRGMMMEDVVFFMQERLTRHAA
ncbi:MAG: UDP-N-acetylmuramoyl-tripeptide--D-alanyl-D-alanine ligase [Ignavibacteriae bacterium]|nr:UDP-N-acetylmuramoyl-tripeptide--D-alanyl-D-alanine ligase [Ignavibacteriota bacterium]